MCLDGEKNDRVAFQARADYQNHAIGWLHRGYSSLAVGKWYDFHEFGWYMGNVGYNFNNQDLSVVPLMKESHPERFFRPDVSITAWRRMVENEARGPRPAEHQAAE